MKPRRSLLTKVILLVTAAYFLIEVVTLLPFAVLYRSTLISDRQDLLLIAADKAEDSWREGIAPISSELPAGPLRGFVNQPVEVFLFENRDPERILAFNAEHRLTPVTEASAPLNRARARVLERFDLDANSPLNHRLSGELLHIRGLRDETGGPIRAVLYASIPLIDVEEQVLELSIISLGSGLLALVIVGAISVLVLRRAVLGPLQQILAADNAGRQGDVQAALIPEGSIPDDELGLVMRSRNRLQVQQLAYQENLDARNAELQRQREALRQWGRTLEAIVERKSAELVQARERLFEQEKLAALGRLAANVAHEINNPLASIAGYAEELREISEEVSAITESEESAHFPEALRVIEDQAFRCKDILKRLLGLARADGLRAERVDLGELLREAVMLAEASARRRGVELRSRATPGAGPHLESDASALMQVVTNLLENAIDAAHAARDARDEPGRVDVSASQRRSDGAQHIVIRVADNGHGIPEAERERIFDEFYTTKPVGRGTGLGLAICQSLTKRLGGRIEVESLEGAGAAFTVLLPIQRLELADEDDTPLPQRPDGAEGDTAAFQLSETGTEPGLEPED